MISSVLIKLVKSLVDFINFYFDQSCLRQVDQFDDVVTMITILKKLILLIKLTCLTMLTTETLLAFYDHTDRAEIWLKYK